MSPLPHVIPEVATRRPADDGGRVLLVCSSGGHLFQLYQLKPWWSRCPRRWVTFPTLDAKSLLSGETVVWAHHPTTRNIPNAVRNLALAFRVIRDYRPSIVVSTGAGVAFPFFVAARLTGVSTAFIETIDGIPSLTGRLCYPLADRFLLQWKEQHTFYPRGVVVGPLL